MLQEVSFTSFNERDQVQGWIYVPAAEPKGVVQLVHGFGEHSRRYLHMIVDYLEAGYVVTADDHVGHGKTAMVNGNSWGDWGDKGFHTMMEDEKKLHDIAAAAFPGIPYFLYGHSMGSFIVRDYISKYGSEIKAAVICGTCGVFPTMEAGIEELQKLHDDGQGKAYNATIGAALMGWMFSRCPEGAKLGNEWICSDPWVQKDHAEDPFDAFTKGTTNDAWLYFCQMMQYITGREWAEKVPKDLPILNIAGDQDPVGSYGIGIYLVSNWLAETGHKDVTTRLWYGYRHEIHNYKDIKDKVDAYIIDFLDRKR
jgi:alpha-beta hydrolase superfamily lysophospholipase